MYSYHALTLLADAHREDLLRAAQPRLRPVAPKRRRGGSLLSYVTGGELLRRRLRWISAPAIDVASDRDFF